MRKKAVLRVVSLLSCSLAPSLARGRCAEPSLSARVPEFEAQQTSRIEALLRFGEANNLCFGIEYVDASLLTDPVNFKIQAGSVQQTVHSILGKGSFLIGSHDGVIEINRPMAETKTKDIFDYVLPAFESKRGSVQEISNLLHMYLVSDLNSQTTGFAGHYFSGDLNDQVGPFRRSNSTLRYLLDAILAQSKGGAWVASIAWSLRGDFKLPEKHLIWTFVEYGIPSSNYAGTLAGIARTIENDLLRNGSDSQGSSGTDGT
jgi:hypothetical protein